MIGKRKLGNQELEASVIGLGCMGMSQSCGPIDEQESMKRCIMPWNGGVIFSIRRKDTASSCTPYTNGELWGKAFRGQRPLGRGFLTGKVIHAEDYGNGNVRPPIKTFQHYTG